jgi:tetratricopeptide (TPR) repeat protein
MGEVMKRASMFEEATLAFQKVIDEYPTSKFADKAQYEVAQCAYKASLQPAYDAGPTDRALRIFEEYAASGKDEKLSEEAKRTMQRLKDKAAEKSMMVAKFYEQQHHPKSAIIYYQDVLDRYPDAICAPVAKTRIEILQVEMARPPAGMFGWFRKAEKGEAAPPAPRKKWTPWSLFGKKGEPAAAAGAPVAAITPPAAMPQAVAPGVAAPAAAKPAPKKKGWDFMEILGLTPDEPKPPAVKPPALEAAVAAAKAGAAAEPEAPPPVAYEEKGVDRASPREDDPNLELDDDDRI